MNTLKKLFGASLLLGVFSLPSGLSATPTSTDAESIQAPVFNLRTPSINRHIYNRDRIQRQAPEKPAPAYHKPVAVVEKSEPVRKSHSSDCGTQGTFTETVDEYLVHLQKTAPVTVSLDEPFQYDYVVTAKADVKKVVVEEQIPAGATYVSSEPEATVSGDLVVWTLHDLQQRDQVPLSLSLKTSGTDDLESCATIKAYPQACMLTSVGVVELDIVKTTSQESFHIGSSVPWDIKITNTGNFCAYDVVVSDTLPEGVEHSSGQRVLTKQIGELAPGESKNLRVNTTAVAEGRSCNEAEVAASNAGSVSDEACIEIYETALDVTKQGTARQYVGKQASYTIVVSNNGGAALNNVVVTDTVPGGTRLIEAPGAQISGNTARWTTDLAPGSSEQFNVTIIGLRGGNYCNEVVVADSKYNLKESASACTEWVGHSALLLEVIDTEDPLLPGDKTTYIIRVTNQGTADDTNIAVNAILPPNLKLVSAAGDTTGNVSGNGVSFAPYGVLRPKEVVEYRIEAEAVSKGDSRFKVNLNSDLLKSPLPEEEATQVY